MRIFASVFLALFLLSLRASAVEPKDDRSTPRRSFELFAATTRAGDFVHAAKLLDLRAVPQADQKERGPELAAELSTVLNQKLSIEPEDLSDDPKGNPAAGVRTQKLGSIRLPKHDPVDITLTLSRSGADQVWLISSDTLDDVPALYAAYGPAWIEKYLPAWLLVKVWSLALWQWIGLAVTVVVGVAIGLLLAHAILAIAKRVSARTRQTWDDELVRAARGPARLLVSVLVVRGLIEPLRLAEEPADVVTTVLKIGLIVAVGFFALRGIEVVTDSLERQAKVEIPEMTFTRELSIRGVRTRLAVMRRVGSIVAIVFTVALVLLQFEAVRTVGVSLLASAGVAGIVVGVAAQKPLAALLAGIQLSITQPIRIGDSVVVESEFGTIEEINLTYVVLKTWDERRLIVPMSLFLEHPFQNWTKVASQLTGAITLRVDFRISMADLRKRFESVLAGNSLWDGRTKVVQVTEAGERTLEVRFLVSAKDAGRLFDLRCDVREKLVAWLTETERGRYLPLDRVDLASAASSNVVIGPSDGQRPELGVT